MVTVFLLETQNSFLTDSNGIRTHNHLVRKRTLSRLAKLADINIQSVF